jgi:hypothetical protein
MEDGRWAKNRLRSAVLWWRAWRNPMKPINKRTSVVLRRRPTRKNKKNQENQRKKNGEGDQQEGREGRRMEAIPPSQGALTNKAVKSQRRRR